MDEKGHFVITEKIPKYLQGQFILKGNKIIIEKLNQEGLLLAKQKIKHSYPYNPRSNSPLIYRVTPQWFFKSR